jgi:hypothetical protein
MPVFQAFRHNPRWRIRAGIALALIVPLYLVPSLLRDLLNGWWGYGLGVVANNVFAIWVIGLITNNYRFGIAVCAGSTLLEMSLLYLGHKPNAALWIGDLIPALFAIFFAQQLYISMGD